MRSARAAGSPGSAISSTETCSPAAPECPARRCSFAVTAFAYPPGVSPNSRLWVRVDHSARHGYRLPVRVR